MIFGAKAHDVKCGSRIGKKHVVQRAVGIVFIAEIKVISIVVKGYFSLSAFCAVAIIWSKETVEPTGFPSVQSYP